EITVRGRRIDFETIVFPLGRKLQVYAAECEPETASKILTMIPNQRRQNERLHGNTEPISLGVAIVHRFRIYPRCDNSLRDHMDTNVYTRDKGLKLNWKIGKLLHVLEHSQVKFPND